MSIIFNSDAIKIGRMNFSAGRMPCTSRQFPISFQEKNIEEGVAKLGGL